VSSRELPNVRFATFSNHSTSLVGSCAGDGEGSRRLGVRCTPNVRSLTALEMLQSPTIASLDHGRDLVEFRDVPDMDHDASSWKAAAINRELHAHKYRVVCR
jgi:hypothetical protein